jgi:hypothetical protein
MTAVASCGPPTRTFVAADPLQLSFSSSPHQQLGGSLVELKVERLGRLRIHIRGDLKRTWPRKTRLQNSQKLAAAGEKPPLTGGPSTQLSGKHAPMQG